MIRNDRNVVLDRVGTEPSLPVTFDAFIDGKNSQVDCYKVSDLVPARDPTVVEAPRNPANHAIASGARKRA
jgi:hypothetical protein